MNRMLFKKESTRERVLGNLNMQLKKMWQKSGREVMEIFQKREQKGKEMENWK